MAKARLPKSKNGATEMTRAQGIALVHNIAECMHLIPDMFLEDLVEHLRGEQRRRGLIHDRPRGEDDVPF